MHTKPTHYYLPNSGGTTTGPHIKEAEFFVVQGGLHEEWGSHWKPITCSGGLVEARQLAREIERQAGSNRYPEELDYRAAELIKEQQEMNKESH